MHMEVLGYNHKHNAGFSVDRPNGIDCWLFLIIKSPAIFKINNEEIAVNGNSIIIYTPYQPQFYYATSDVYYDDWMHFVPDDFEKELIEKFGLPLNTPVSFSSVADISAIMHNLCEEFYSSNYYRFDSSQHLFKLLLYKIGEKYLSKKSGAKIRENIFHESFIWNSMTDENLVKAEKSHYFNDLITIRENIFRWPTTKWTVEDLASGLSLSKSRFQHIYKEAFGKSLYQDIGESRIQAAIKLLQESEYTAKYISVAVGYSSVSHFTKQFREATGMSPIEFRKNYILEQKE